MLQAVTRLDVAVVGGGTAGSIMAARLSEDPARSVALVEAGPDYGPTHDRLPEELRFAFRAGIKMASQSAHCWRWPARATDTAPEMVFLGGRALGGGSAVNGQIFFRGLPYDFDAWSARGNDEWSFDKVLPCFVRLENDRDFDGPYHGKDGPVPVRRFPPDRWAASARAFHAAALEHGFAACDDFNRPYATGAGPTPYANANEFRTSAAVAYLWPARLRPNLTIRGDARVLTLSLRGDRTTGVVVSAGGGTELIEAEQVILTAGAVGSPTLLMRSGIGPAKHLEGLGIPVVADLPGVGRGLRDHPLTPTSWFARADPPRDPDTPYSGLPRLRYTSPGSRHTDDMLITILPYWTGDGNEFSEPLLGFQLIPQLELTEGQGTLRLRSADPDDPPLVDCNYLREETDRQRLVDGVRLCIELARSAAFKDFEPRLAAPTEPDLSSDAALETWVMQNVTTSYHASSTCRMGPTSDPDAVVDQYGRVREIENLRIADASIMPDSVRGNINGTVMAVAEHLSDFVRAGT